MGTSEMRQVTSRPEKWELIERWCERYPYDWKLLFKRNEVLLELTVPEDIWRAFDLVGINAG